MNKLIVWIIVALLVVVGAILAFNIFGKSQGGDTVSLDSSVYTGSSSEISEDENEIIETESVETESRTYNIDIKSFAFQTPGLTINIGDSVTWTNMDSVAHTVTSDSGSELDSEYLSKGEGYSHTFTQTGIFNYHCIPHPYMKAKIVVN